MKNILTIAFLFLSCSAIVLGQQTAIFNYTGQVQYFVVPAGVDSIQFDLRGAAGQQNSYLTGTPGKGGRALGMFAVAAGDTLELFVGGQCNDDPEYIGNGGNGGSSTTGYTGGCGGGASVLRYADLTAVIAIAGGGGGCGGIEFMDTTTTYGGDGGALTAGNGENGAAFGGSGGDQTLDGLGGQGAGICGFNGMDGANGTGGNGGAITCGNGFVSGAGGGGGYKAGGGGGGAAYLTCCPDWSGGGGGGSSFTHVSAIDVVHTPGFQVGLGQIILFYDITTSISSATLDNDLLAFPNPTSGIIQIDLGTVSSEVTISAYNVLGELVQAEIRGNTNGIVEYEMPDQKGIYLIQVVYPDGMVNNLKVVKE